MSDEYDPNTDLMNYDPFIRSLNSQSDGGASKAIGVVSALGLVVALVSLPIIEPMNAVNGDSTGIKDKSFPTLPARLLGYKQFTTDMTKAEKHYTDYVNAKISICQTELGKIESENGLKVGTTSTDMFKAIALRKILPKLQEAVADADKAAFLKKIDGLNERTYSYKAEFKLTWIVRDAIKEAGITDHREKEAIEDLFFPKAARRDDYNLNESTNKATPAATVTEITSSANIKFTPTLTMGT